MPGHSRSKASYSDVEAVLDTVLRERTWPAYFRLPTRSAAITWRARANAFRVLLRKMEEERNGLPVGDGTSIYDNLTFRFAPNDSSTILIEEKAIPGNLEIGGETVTPISDRQSHDESAVEELFNPPDEGDLI